MDMSRATPWAWSAFAGSKLQHTLHNRRYIASCAGTVTLGLHLYHRLHRCRVVRTKALLLSAFVLLGQLFLVPHEDAEEGKTSSSTSWRSCASARASAKRFSSWIRCTFFLHFLMKDDYGRLWSFHDDEALQEAIKLARAHSKFGQVERPSRKPEHVTTRHGWQVR
ncbi:unnamed protein product [Durusdinium trenchii]|uniref:Uncharacterized protein n=1 Tax=Durusdinium trenchii TaxID=1381693 RepID=A0ABP0R014_9DINO